MHVLIAPDDFSASLPAAEAAAAMGEGVLRVYPDAVLTRLPLPGGGEGILEAALAAGYQQRSAVVRGPLDRPVTADWALSPNGQTAVVEARRSSGLLLTEPSVQTALAAHSHGVGELIFAALDAGAREIILATGGSAMTDGGAGALRALGGKVLDHAGAAVPLGGGGLILAAEVDAAGLDPRLAEVNLRIITDGRTPVTGPEGAALAAAKDKGADESGCRLLDEALVRWVRILADVTGRRIDLPGAGAGGGLPAAFLSFTSATLEDGFGVLARISGLPDALATADLVLTGRGSLEGRQAFAETPLLLAAQALERGIPVVVIAEKCTVPPDRLAAAGVAAVVNLLDVAPSPAEAEKHAEKYLVLATQQALEGA